MRTVVARDAAREPGIAGVVGAVVVDVLRPRVVRHDVEAAGEALVELHLQRVVVVAGVAAVVAQVLRPAELLEERLALIGGQRAEAVDVGLIGIVVAAGAGEDVSALGADVADLKRRRRS